MQRLAAPRACALPVVSSVLDGLRAESRGLDVIITQVDELLPLKNKIDELRKRVKEIKRAITDILNNDEDMAMMYLPGGPLPVASSPTAPVAEEAPAQATVVYHGFKKRGLNGEIIDTMNLEMLFENYLNEIEWIASELEEMHDEIINTEENVVLQLDLLRNRILRFELFLSISSFVVTYGTLIAGVFGMNLLSHFEQNGFFFYAITALIVSSMGAYSWRSRVMGAGKSYFELFNVSKSRNLTVTGWSGCKADRSDATRQTPPRSPLQLPGVGWQIRRRRFLTRLAVWPLRSQALFAA